MVQGHRVPWEIEGYRDDFRRAEREGGFFDLSDWSAVRVHGPDARDYLQRMSTIDFRTFSTGEVRRGAFLTGRGQILAMGSFLECDGGYDFIVSPGQLETVLEHLEKFHFGEKLAITDASEEWALFALWNPQPGLLHALGVGGSVSPAFQRHTVFAWNTRFELWRDDSRDRLWWVRIKRADAIRLLKSLHDEGVGLLGQRLFEYYRILSAVPRMGCEATSHELVLELNYDGIVARNKGCYPGQEVVERIFSYGSVNRKLFPIELVSEDGRFPEPPIRLTHEGKDAGYIASWAQVPEDMTRAVGLGFLLRKLWDTSSEISTAGGDKLQIRLKKMG